MTLLHLSDLHFGTERPAVARALIDQAQAWEPEAIVVSGDITQRARRAEFVGARAFLAALPAVPLLITPGNHDITLFNPLERLLRPYAAQEAALGQWGMMERTWQSAGWHVTSVNTTRWWRHKHGEISRRQLQQVAAGLRQARPDQVRVVVVHHPMAVPAAYASERADLLRGARQAALAAWAEAGADLVVGGHIHLPYVLSLTGLARPLAVAQAGTAVSSRVRREVGNSLNRYRHDGRTLTVERWDHDGQAFVCVAQTALPLARP